MLTNASNPSITPMPVATSPWKCMPLCDGFAAERDGAIDDDAEQRDDERRAREAELLDEHGEHEVRVRLRQVEQLLHALAQAHAAPFAAADRHQRLRQLEARRERIRPRIAERHEPHDAIVGREREHRRARAPPTSTASRRSRSRAPPTNSTVRLVAPSTTVAPKSGSSEQQHGRRPDDEQRLDQAVQARRRAASSGAPRSSRDRAASRGAPARTPAP